jgi:aminoglycoside phosphotransferase (APT) family kinase protein
VLTPLDADLARRDSAVPGLALVLDADAFVGALGRSVPEADVSGARITYVKYKPGTNCLVGFRLVVDGNALDVYAKAYRTGATKKLHEAQEEPGRPGLLGRGRIPLYDHVVVVSTFENDARVSALSSVAETPSGFLSDLLPARPALWSGTLEGLVYKPERRWVARLSTEDGAQAVVKLYTPWGYELLQPHRRPYAARPPLRLASTLGASARHAALAFEWLPGRLLSEAILDPQLDARAVAKVGSAVAQLHALSTEGFAQLEPEGAASTLLAEADTLGILCPHLGQRAKATARRIAARLVARPPARRCLIHGDLHARQVLLDGDTVAILDLDRALCADPLIDVGVFAAHLEREVIRGHLAASRVESLGEAMLGGYAAERPETAVADDTRLHTAAELFRLAPQFFRYREPDWPERTAACLDRVEAILAPVPVY